MKKLLTIGMLMAAAFSLQPQAAVADESEDVAETTPYYVRGALIIHVPRPDMPAERVNLRASRDDDEIAPPPRRRITPKPQRRVDLPLRKPFNVSPSPPPPAGPRRAVLSAPPPRIGGPIYPTPRFEAKAAVAEKIVPPPETAVTADAPPAGYTPPPPAPPAAIPADEPSTDDQ